MVVLRVLEGPDVGGDAGEPIDAVDHAEALDALGAGANHGRDCEKHKLR